MRNGPVISRGLRRLRRGRTGLHAAVAPAFLAVLAALAVLVAAPPHLAAQLEPPPRLQGEIGLSLGAEFSLAAAEALHRQAWATPPLAGMAVENRLSASPSMSVFLGGSFSRFSARGLGWTAGFGYAKNSLPASSAFKTGGAAAVVYRTLSASPDRGEITSVPLYLGLALRSAGRRSTLAASIGPALYLHSILVETEAGILAAASGGAAGAFRAAVSVPDQTWIAAGLQAGLALDIPLSAPAALFFEARYFYSPRKSFDWTWASGSLDGLDSSAAQAAFDAIAASAATAATAPLKVDPSLFHVSAGLRIRLR